MPFADTEINRKLARRIFMDDLNECTRFPKYFELETVHACNARCIMCTIDNWAKADEALMKEDLFRKFAKEVGQYSDWIETICLSRDGEPTLDKTMPQKVKLLKNAGIKKVTLTTNAQLLTSDFSSRLILSGLDDIMISIDGATRETFERIRRGLSFEKVVNNTLELIRIRDSLDSPMTIRIRMVILHENQHEVDDFIAFWSGKIQAKDRVYAMPAHTWGNQIVITGTSNDKQISEPCVFLFSSMAMHVDGKVSLCNADYGIRYPMGDFKHQSIKEIWNGKLYEKVRDLHASGRREEIDMCVGCDLWNRVFVESK
ncbi:MAG: radical SAM/SPASM domain-containing protein [Deltaproteobacteria bacterium]